MPTRARSGGRRWAGDIERSIWVGFEGRVGMRGWQERRRSDPSARDRAGRSKEEERRGLVLGLTMVPLFSWSAQFFRSIPP